MSEFIPYMPAIFVGHGSPMNALGGPYAEAWRALGASIPRPKAILCVSAHWYVEETAVTAMERPRTIHDFYGFPKPLYDIAYPAPGDAWLAERVRDLLAPLAVRPDHDWGLDHGSWSVLRHMFPDADIPVVQLAMDARQRGLFHFGLGRQLQELRDEGVLILGSGDVVHNLRMARWEAEAGPYDWAVRFEKQVKAAILAHDNDSLAAFETLGEDAALAIPTPEHYLPLLYVLGTAGREEPISFFNDKIELGSVSMLGVRIG